MFVKQFTVSPEIKVRFLDLNSRVHAYTLTNLWSWYNHPCGTHDMCKMMENGRERKGEKNKKRKLWWEKRQGLETMT